MHARVDGVTTKLEDVASRRLSEQRGLRGGGEVSKARLGSSRLSTLAIVLTLTLLIALSIPTPALAATLRVRPGGGGGYYATIQAAVNAANANDVILVYPGTYGAVVLNTMATPGNISIIAVDSSGTPTPGTVTVNAPGTSAFESGATHPGDVTIDGFVVTGAGQYGINVWAAGDAVIRNVTADGAVKAGLYVTVPSPYSGDVTIEGCSANSTGSYGVEAFAYSGNVVVRNTTANGTGSVGIFVTTLGNVTVRNCTANNNSNPVGGNGISLVQINGNVTVQNCTANNNYWDGIGVGAMKTVRITGCIASGNGRYGISPGPLGTGPTVVNGNVICANGTDGLYGTGTVDAEGNWWGCSGGPGSPGCDTVGGNTPVIDFTPWISTYTADTTPGSALVGESVHISFQFADSAGTMFLPKGPGDLNGSPTFTLHTDNGTLTDADEEGATVHGFIGDGDVLAVTLVPDALGTATVTADGPCDLAAAITIEVTEPIVEEEEFVPEPGSMILLGSGLTGLAGYAALRLGSGQAIRRRGGE
jgi:hypothetical protein